MWGLQQLLTRNSAADDDKKRCTRLSFSVKPYILKSSVSYEYHLLELSFLDKFSKKSSNIKSHQNTSRPRTGKNWRAFVNTVMRPFLVLLGDSWLRDELSASQEGLCSVKSVASWIAGPRSLILWDTLLRISQSDTSICLVSFPWENSYGGTSICLQPCHSVPISHNSYNYPGGL